MALVSVQGRLDRGMGLIEARLGEATFFAGDEITAADMMSVFSLTTMRLLQSTDLQPYPHIRASPQRVGERAAYRRVMTKGIRIWRRC